MGSTVSWWWPDKGPWIIPPQQCGITRDLCEYIVQGRPPAYREWLMESTGAGIHCSSTSHLHLSKYRCYWWRKNTPLARIRFCPGQNRDLVPAESGREAVRTVGQSYPIRCTGVKKKNTSQVRLAEHLPSERFSVLSDRRRWGSAGSW